MDELKSGPLLRPDLTKAIANDWRSSSYYDQAEQWLKGFWSDQSPFRELFGQLDPTVLVELACGHGRHTQIFCDRYRGDPASTSITLIDVNESNAAFCKERFREVPGVTILQNGGADFQPVESQSVTAIFCYDAMVHFEFDAVISYIFDAYRILRPGGRCLFHHSNYDQNPGGLVRENPHWRNFMTSRLFKHAARRAGFNVLDQRLLDWGFGDSFTKAIDCLSLLEKPAA